jgi:hypothetical protein
MTLLELVREAYRNAVENGYDLTGCNVREIAYDMLECDAVIEVADASIEEVEAAVVIVVGEDRVKAAAA